MKTHNILQLLSLSCLIIFSACSSRKTGSSAYKSVYERASERAYDELSYISDYFIDSPDNKVNANFTDSLFIVPKQQNKQMAYSYMKDQNIGLVRLYDEVKELFNPDKSIIPFRPNVLRDLKRDTIKWIPEDVKNYVKQLAKHSPASDWVVSIPRRDIIELLKMFKIKRVNGNIISAKIDIDYNVPIDYFMEKNYTSVNYSLDANGYLNYLLNTSMNTIINNLEVIAKESYKSNKSLYVGGGTLFSPISESIYGRETDKILSDTNRLLILKLIDAKARAYKASENDSIMIAQYYTATWMAGNGKTNFNSNASFNTNIGINYIFASASLKASGEVTVTRSSTFTDFAIYISDMKYQDEYPFITIKELREKIAYLEKKSPPKTE